MTRVLIGGAGAPNYGDELILKKWVQLMEELDPSAEWLVFQNIAQNAERMHRRYAGRANVKFSDALARVAKRVEGLSFWQQVLRGYHFIERGGVKIYGQDVLRKISEASTVHLHGGGYLNAMDASKGFWLGIAASAARLSGARCFATGIGFGPVEKPQREDVPALAEVFSQFDVIELRDVEGFRFLSRLFPHSNFTYGFDDCYLASPDNLASPGRKTLFLSFVAYNIDKLPKQFWDDLRGLSERYEKVTFLESYPWQDKAVFERVKGEMSDCSKLSCSEAVLTPFSVGDGSFALTSRFHYHFILARCGVPGLYMQDTEYYRTKHQSIVDRGSRFLEYAPGDNLPSAVKAAEARKGDMLSNDRFAVTQKYELAKRLYRVGA